MSQMTPREIVEELDKHIVGQKAAKRAVAIALRNRWRRGQVAESLRPEITPKNILMIGPTGVGKTEIARRLARLAKAPFIKVEATKFTEVGYVGREVDSIVRDLVEISVKMTREEEIGQGAPPRRRCGGGPRPRCAVAARPGGLRRRTARRAITTPGSASARCCASASSTIARSRSKFEPMPGGRRDHGAARHGGDDAAAAGHVSEPRRRQRTRSRKLEDQARP